MDTRDTLHPKPAAGPPSHPLEPHQELVLWQDRLKLSNAAAARRIGVDPATYRAIKDGSKRCQFSKYELVRTETGIGGWPEATP
jgi:hypothetical protein